MNNAMSGSFIIIDPSIKRPGGHHYEYAERIARAAEAEGRTALVLTHKDCTMASGAGRAGLVPAFRRTFWENYQHYYSEPQVDQRWNGLKALLPEWCSIRRRRDRWKFTRLGLAFARAREMRLREIIFRRHIVHEITWIPSSRIQLAFCWSVLAVIGLLRSLSSRFVSLLRRTGLSYVIKWLVVIPGMLLMAILLLPAMLRRAVDPGEVFAADCDAALRRHHFDDDDVVFVPNATPAELLGYARLFAAKSPIVKAQWAFLFRRPVYNGYPASYSSQNEAARIHRVHLDMLRRQANGARVSFYTDTDELTAQWNRLGVYRFTTLPVPVDTTLERRRPEPSEPLTVGYLGDARDEKGFGLLPKLVENVLSKTGGARKVRFLIQSNFNTPGGEPGSAVARRLLQAYDSTEVELVEGPFDSTQYAELIKRIDIMLIPYSAENYSARSSGVLAEAVAAGIPAIVPAASWMAAVGEPLRLKQLKRVFDGTSAGVRRTDILKCPYRRIHNVPFRWGQECNYLRVRLVFADGQDRWVRIVASLNDEYGMPTRVIRVCVPTVAGSAVVAFSLRGASEFSFVAAPVEAQVLSEPSWVTMEAFHASHPLVLQGGVAVYHDDGDIGSVLDEMIAMYDTYKNLAGIARDELTPLYDPAVLVRRVCCVSTSEDACKARAVITSEVTA